MAFFLDKFEVMEYLWDTLDKLPDGQHIRYTALDIEQLWWMGFVDAQQFPIDQWKGYFEQFLQPDGTFVLGRDDFLALEKYRYKGEVRVPFDAMRINEGRYTVDGLKELFDLSIGPSCCLSKDELNRFIEGIINDFKLADGLIQIGKPAKERIGQLLATYPSPLRNIEILMDRMITERGGEVMGTVEQADAAMTSMRAAMQESSFSASPTSKVEAKAVGLKALEKVKKQERTTEIAGTPKTQLSKIKRSRKGIRG